MTIRELADTAGCNPETVRRIVAIRMPEKMRKGKVTRFTWDEAHALMAVLPKTNTVDLPQPTTPSVVGVGGSGQITAADFAALIPSIVAETVKALAPTLLAMAGKSSTEVRPQIAAPQLVPDIPMRKQVVNLVNEYSAKHEASNFESTWTRLYREFGDRYGINVKARASHKGIKPIDWVDREGLMESLYLVAITIFSRGAA